MTSSLELNQWTNPEKEKKKKIKMRHVIDYSLTGKAAIFGENGHLVR